MVEVVHALRRHNRDVREALAGGNHVDMVGDQLVHITVTGDEQHVATGGLAAACERAQDVVAFPALGLHNGHADGLEQLLDHGELLAQVIVHGRALRLVLRQHLHAHGGTALVERADHAVRVKGVDHLEKHVEKAEDGVGGAPVRSIHGRRHGMERAVHQRVAVDDGHHAAAGRGCGGRGDIGRNVGHKTLLCIFLLCTSLRERHPWRHIPQRPPLLFRKRSEYARRDRRHKGSAST